MARQIAGAQWFFLLLLLPIVLLISPARSPLLLILPALWLTRKVAFGRFVPSTVLNLSLLLLLVMVLVSVLVTYDLAFSLAKVAAVLYGVALFFAVVDFGRLSSSRLWMGVAMLVAAGLGVVALGLLGVDWRTKLPVLASVLRFLPQRVINVPGSDLGINPNELAGILLWTAPLSLCLAVGFTTRRHDATQGFPIRLRRLVLPTLWGATLVQSSTVILTQSRGALLGLGAGLLVTLLLLTGRHRRKLMLSIAVAAVALALVVWQAGLGRATEFFFAQSGLDATENALSTLEGRQEIWTRAVYGIQDFPFTGMGMNTFREVVHILYPLFLIPPDTDIAHAHNHLLQTALDLGLPGLIAYLAMWLGTYAMLWRSWQCAPNVAWRILTAGFAASLTAYFVYGLVDAVALGARPGFLFWLLLGLIAAQYSLVVEGPDQVGGELKRQPR